MQVTYKRVPIDSLFEDPANARKHGERNLETISNSLRCFGQVESLVVQKSTGKVIGGNGRLRVMKDLGWDEVDIAEVDITDVQSVSLGIALNRTAELAEWDDEILAATLNGLALEEGLLEAAGYDEEELAAMLAEIDDAAVGEVTEDEVPEPPADPITKPGDLWILGRHRVLCGDSTKAEDVARLMDREKADAVITDPPYGVSYVGKTKDALPVHNDGRDTLLPLLQSALGLAHELSSLGSPWYVAAPAGPQLYDFATVLRNLEVWRQTLVWVKQSLVMGHSDYHYQHEAIFYGWKKGKQRTWNSDRCEVTVWEEAKTVKLSVMKKPDLIELIRQMIAEREKKQTSVLREDRPTSSQDHPTMKPVRLFAKMMKNSTRKECLVYDPFLGSGTTLIAAEQLGRKCYGMEISPQYCDVIVKRWETLTGQKATCQRPTRD
jgi:DNA modification methylase